MEQGHVLNNSSEEVSVMYGGLNYYFDAGEVRSFPFNVAEAIANENADLSLEEPEKEIRPIRTRKSVVAPTPIIAEDEAEEVVEAPEEDPEEEKDVYEAKVDKKGVTQYLKNGKPCSRLEYETR